MNRDWSSELRVVISRVPRRPSGVGRTVQRAVMPFGGHHYPNGHPLFIFPSTGGHCCYVTVTVTFHVIAVVTRVEKAVTYSRRSYLIVTMCVETQGLPCDMFSGDFVRAFCVLIPRSVLRRLSLCVTCWPQSAQYMNTFTHTVCW